MNTMEIRLPAKYEQLKLKHLQVLMTTEDPVTRVSACCNLSLEATRALPLAQIEAANWHLNDLLEAEVVKHEKMVTLGGKLYGMIPDFSRMTTGEWIDATACEADFWPNADKFFSIIYRPVTRHFGNHYEIEEYTAEHPLEPLREMPAPAVGGAMAFFLTIREELLSSLMNSLAVEARAMLYPKDGVGMTPSISYQEKAF